MPAASNVFRSIRGQSPIRRVSPDRRAPSPSRESLRGWWCLRDSESSREDLRRKDVDANQWNRAAPCCLSDRLRACPGPRTFVRRRLSRRRRYDRLWRRSLRHVVLCRSRCRRCRSWTQYRLSGHSVVKASGSAAGDLLRLKESSLFSSVVKSWGSS